MATYRNLFLALLVGTTSVTAAFAGLPYHDEFILQGDFQVDPGVQKSGLLGGNKFKLIDAPITVSLQVDSTFYAVTRHGRATITVIQGKNHIGHKRLNYEATRDSITRSRDLLEVSSLIGGTRALPFTLKLNPHFVETVSQVTKHRTLWCGYKCADGTGGSVITTNFGSFDVTASGSACVNAGYQFADVTYDEYSADVLVEVLNAEGTRIGTFTSPFAKPVQKITNIANKGECSVNILPADGEDTPPPADASREAVPITSSEF